MPDPAHPDALWWALALGADFGGNMTAVGASANVVMLGIARRDPAARSRSGSSPARASAVTAITVFAGGRHLWLRYFVLA